MDGSIFRSDLRFRRSSKITFEDLPICHSLPSAAVPWSNMGGELLITSAASVNPKFESS